MKGGGPRARERPICAGARLGRYDLGERVGRGGAASVYLARRADRTHRDSILAIKVVHEHLLAEREFVDMFLDEAHLALRLVHPNIVHTVELGQVGDRPFLVMEYLPGQPLSALIDRCRTLGKKLPYRLCAWIGLEACRALAYAHDAKGDNAAPLGLIHRDISPQNLFLTYDGRVKVIDFGIAKAAGRITETALGRIKGKFNYMAPEQMLSQSFDQRVDLFALGNSLYEASTGQRPFDATDDAEAVAKLLGDEIPDPRTLRPDFPLSLKEILFKALERDPKRRYSTAREFGRALSEFAGTDTDDFRVELGEWLTTCFPRERRAQERSIAKLRSAAPARQLPADTLSPEERDALRVPESHRRRPRPVRVIYAALGTLALAGGVALLASSHLTPPVPAGPQAADHRWVSLEIQVDPPVQSELHVAGQRVRDRSPSVLLPRSSHPVDIRVTADGFEDVELQEVPDRSRRVVVSLTPVGSLALPTPSSTDMRTAR